MASNLPPGCGPLPGEGPAAEAAEALGDALYEIIEKHLGPEDKIPGDVDMLVQDLMELVGTECRRAISDYQAEAALVEEEQKASEAAKQYWKEQSRATDPCPKCGGKRIVPDGAHYSGLGKDYGGMYCPDCT